LLTEIFTYILPDTQKKREAKKADKAAKKATHKAAGPSEVAQDQDDGPDVSAGK
jgi:hypothetical protein